MDTVLTKNATRYESEKLNWLGKHSLEILFAVTLLFMTWAGNMLLNLSNRMAVTETKIEHIDQAVNNASPNEPTLREMVEDISARLDDLNTEIQK